MTSLQITSSNADMLPSTPILKGDALYDGALALAVAAGAVKPDQEPQSILFNHATRQWHIAH